MTFLTLLTSTVTGAPNRGQRSVYHHHHLLVLPVDDTAVASVIVLEEEVLGSD